MLTPSQFHPYQVRAIKHCLEHPRSAVWLFMSAGKTVIALSAFAARQVRLEAVRALVVAPLRVAELTWRQEAKKWSHLQRLTVSLLRGDKDYKTRELHRPDVDVHVINYEALPWLTKTCKRYFIAKGKPLPWNFLILDEVDRFKDSQGKRLSEFESLLVPPGCKPKHQFAPNPDAETAFPYRMGLTGTPASNGLIDLHGQFRVLDGGKRLYWFLGDFRTMFCSLRGAREDNTWKVMRPEAKTEIMRRVGDITLSLNEEEHIKLPDYLFHDHWVDLPPSVAEAYAKFEKKFFAAMDRHEDDPLDGELELEATSRPSARMKCRQLANGALKIEGDAFQLAHDAKLEVLDQIIHEANGRPVLLSYLFRADMHRIRERYKRLRVAYIGPGTKDAEAIVDAWNRQEWHLLVSHPASIGHGLNLQDGGNEIVWFGPTDNPRFWHQFNARLRRQGQKEESVHIRRILARGTVDEPIVEAIDSKNLDETEFRRKLEAYRERKLSST